MRGPFLIYDFNQNSYSAGHAERIDRRLIPASTFKIFNSLVALETGVIADHRTVIKWDGITRKRNELNRDLDLQTAFRISAVPHYQELSRRIGVERMQHFIDAVRYGNRDISGGIDEFWLTGGLKISPREQVDFLVRLYRGDLPFSATTMKIVREMMATEEFGFAFKGGSILSVEQWALKIVSCHVCGRREEAASFDIQGLSHSVTRKE